VSWPPSGSSVFFPVILLGYLLFSFLFLLHSVFLCVPLPGLSWVFLQIFFLAVLPARLSNDVFHLPNCMRYLHSHLNSDFSTR
jgi:hypothetical protein